jgi:hypothetical protein
MVTVGGSGSGSTTLKERTTPDSRNTPSTTILEEEVVVEAPGNDGNASMPERVKRPNPWRKMMMIPFLNQFEILFLGREFRVISDT